MIRVSVCYRALLACAPMCPPYPPLPRCALVEILQTNASLLYILAQRTVETEVLRSAIDELETQEAGGAG